MIALLSLSERSGYTVHQLLNDISLEFLNMMLSANDKITTRNFYKDVISTRLSDEGLKTIEKDFSATFSQESTEEIVDTKPKTIADLEREVAKMPGAKIHFIRKTNG